MSDEHCDLKEWRDDRGLVLFELSRMGKALERLEVKIDSRHAETMALISSDKADLMALKTQASYLGAAAGAIVAGLFSILGFKH